MAFWSSLKKDSISLFLKKNFGVKPKNLAIYQQAFTHSSYAENPLESNERLEFLGDAILDSVVGEYLYLHYPKKDEGFLTKMRSKIVNRASLNQLGNKYDLVSIVKHQKGIHRGSIEGNAFEALIGAIYLDSGYKTTKRIIEEIIQKEIILKDLEKIETEYKSKLYQWCQKNKFNVETRFTRFETQIGFSYKATLFIENTLIGEGIGLSKKIAEKIAAEQAFQSGVLNKFIVK